MQKIKDTLLMVTLGWLLVSTISHNKQLGAVEAKLDTMQVSLQGLVQLHCKN